MFPGEFTVGHFLGQRVDSYLLCQELAQVLRRQERCLSDQCHHTRALEFVQLVSDQFLSNEGATRTADKEKAHRMLQGCYLKLNNK